jgi:hypothetical protein
MQDQSYWRRRFAPSWKFLVHTLAAEISFLALTLIGSRAGLLRTSREAEEDVICHHAREAGGIISYSLE